jgi:hypothetical protein
MEEGTGPMKELEERLSTLNLVRDPIDKEREPLKRFEPKSR